jgi:Uma2 family endonuclease
MATSSVSTPLVTASEYARLEDPPGMATELVRGTVVTKPQPRTAHGRRAGRISRQLEEFAERHDLGLVTYEGDYLLTRNPDTVRAPDAAFLPWSRLAGRELPEDEWIEGSPPLVVEVISPSDRDSDVSSKIAEWLEHGAERVWEVLPRTRTVTVHQHGAPPRTLGVGQVLTSDDATFDVPGFALPVADIFA